MNKAEISIETLDAHNHLIQKVQSQTLEIATRQVNDKWSPIQNIRHIEKSIAPLARLFSDKERFLSKNLGSSVMGSRAFSEITSTYRNFLQPGNIKSPEKFIPEPISSDQVQFILDELKHRVQELIQAIDDYSEEELDTYQIPHPLLGLLTMREFMYFNIYHAEHHLKNVERVLEIISPQ